MSNAPRDQRARRSWGDDDSLTPILHVDMDSFFAQVEIQEDPSLAGRTVIVGGRGNRGVVTSATYDARAYGVRAGMPISRARALCPTALVVPGRRGIYSQYSARVMTILREITDKVEQVSVDEAFLDVAGARRRLGAPVAIGRLIRARIRDEVGLPASVGIAAVKSVAKIASAHAKPDGLLLIPRDQTTAFLHCLPVGALWGVGAVTRARLDTEGIDTIGDLAHTDLARLSRLLGAAHAHQLHNLAWGIDPRPVQPRGDEKSVGTESTFDEDIIDRRVIDRFLLTASHDCARRLRSGSMVAWTVVFKMRGADFHTITRSTTLHSPTDVGRTIFEAVRSLFAAEAIPAGGVRLCGVRCEGLQSRLDGVAVTLDGDEKPLASERAMDDVRLRFGRDALRPASLLGPRDEPESH